MYRVLFVRCHGLFHRSLVASQKEKKKRGEDFMENVEIEESLVWAY